MRRLLGIGIVALLSIMAVPYAQVQFPGQDNLGDPSGAYYVTVHGRFAVVGRGTLELQSHDDGTMSGSWHVRRSPGSTAPSPYPLFDGPVDLANVEYSNGLGVLGVLGFSIGRGFNVLMVQIDDAGEADVGSFRVFRGSWRSPNSEDFTSRYGGLVQLSTIDESAP